MWNLDEETTGRLIHQALFFAPSDWTIDHCRALIEFVERGCHPMHPHLDLQHLALQLAVRYFGDKIYLRGLVEISNICRNDCYYCGIRKSHGTLRRYRMEEAEILATCQRGWEMGFRTFVLQGGEDPYWQSERLVRLVAEIRQRYPDSAITLSLGEMPRERYQQLYDAGANRYLLRHETITPEHYAKLHPPTMSIEQRRECLMNLRRIGFQVGVGVMVGSPFQTTEHLAHDLLFIAHFEPEMIGIGPFIPHPATPFASYPAGRLEQVLGFLALCRIAAPSANIPATTAMATLHPEGRTMAMQHGANVVMPNLTPLRYRESYDLYEGKACHGAEAAEGIAELETELKGIGRHISWERGDYREPSIEKRD